MTERRNGKGVVETHNHSTRNNIRARWNIEHKSKPSCNCESKTQLGSDICFTVSYNPVISVSPIMEIRSNSYQADRT
jgi:hypothetical protein